MTKLTKTECLFICIALGILITLILYNVFDTPPLYPNGIKHTASAYSSDQETINAIMDELEESDNYNEESSEQPNDSVITNESSIVSDNNTYSSHIKDKETSKNTNSNKNSNTVVSKPQGGKININTASTTELMELPGIGEVLASRIVEYRTQNHGFGTIEEIKEVNGIGDGRFNKIKDLICVR